MSKIQKQSVKNATEIVADGATIADLINDDQIYISSGSINKTLKQAITDSDIGSVIYSAATFSLAAGATLTVSTTKYLQMLTGTSTGGAVSLSTTPFSTTVPINGTRVTVICTSDTNRIKILHNDAAKGCLLKGDADLFAGYALELIYNSTMDRYIELTRNF